MKKLLSVFILILILTSILYAFGNKSIKLKILTPEEWFKENPGSLPHWMTEEEKLRIDEIGKDFLPTEPPSSPIRQPAEFEPMEGVLIRYPFGISTSIIAEMAEDVIVYCVVASYQQSNAYNSMASAGVNMDNVQFINCSTETYWIRDYGPWFIFNGENESGIVDFIYNRPRPNDDAVSGHVGSYLGIDVYGMNLVHTGGNYMTDGQGIAVSTDLVYDENHLSFESGVFCDLWNFSGNANWSIDNITAYNGFLSARTGEIGDNETTTLSINLYVTDNNYPIEIKFFKKVSCENSPYDDADYLAFYIDGIEKDRWDGEIDWSEENFSLSTGSHIFEWRYIKNETISEGYDCAWIDYILFPISEPTIRKEIVHNLSEDYLGINTYHVVPDALGEYIKHIDCWAKYLAPDVIMIIQVSSSHSHYAEIEAAADYFESQLSCYGTPYQIERVYTHLYEPYINSLILNNKVLIPITGSVWDNDAIASYQTAMPGYEVLGFTGSWESTDALHCRTMGVTDRGMLYIKHTPVEDTVYTANDYFVQANITPYSDENVIEDSTLVYWKTSDEDKFNAIQMLHAGNRYFAFIPSQLDGTTIQYYIHSADSSGRSENHPYIGAPDAHSFYVQSGVSTDTQIATLNNVILYQNYPNPFSSSTTISFNLATRLRSASPGQAKIEIYNIRGQLVRTLTPMTNDKCLMTNVVWDGKDENRKQVPNGIYFYQLKLNNEIIKTKKMVLMR